MALWPMSVFGRRLFSRRRFTFGAIVASLPFIGYVVLLAPSKRLSHSVSEWNSISTTWNATADCPCVTRQHTRNNTEIQNTRSIPTEATATTGTQQVKHYASRSTGRLEVHTWTDICGANVEMLRNWPHFPYSPDKRSFISEFHKIQDRGSINNGERVFGFLHPQKSGEYKFAITSDDTSELWLSPNDDPASSEMIARVYSPQVSAWTEEGNYKKYPAQVSKEFTLHADQKYYIECLLKQGAGAAHIAVYWSCNNSEFEIITSEYLSTFSENNIQESSIPLHAGKQSHILLQAKYNLYAFNRLPLINRQEYISLLQSCPYNPSFLVHRKLKRYEGVSLTRQSNVFPQDGTDMSSQASRHPWSQPNPLVDGNAVQLVVTRFVNPMQIKRNYFLKKIHQVIHKPDPKNGDRFLLNLELGSKDTDQSFRLSEHVYKMKDSDVLCFPEGISWNNNAKVYFILPVKDQGNWVHFFIHELTAASLLTGDTNFHVMVVDFESKDIDMAAAFNTSLLSSRHTIIPLTGKFYKTLALNKAVELVPNLDDIIFLYDLHIDVPPGIMDSVRMNTIAGKMVYSPIVGRLDCDSTTAEQRGFWQLDGYGLLGIYKSDWNRFGGMNAEEFKYKWGGEDWDLLDRVLMLSVEVERLRHPGLYHHYHSRQKIWN